MKVYYNRFLPRKGYICTMFFGIIIARKEYRPLTDGDIRHEEIHREQAMECGGYLVFYLIYLRLWLRYGYDNNPFEKEAAAGENDPEYLSVRRNFAWYKYVKKSI
jgi:hypothetical protein